MTYDQLLAHYGSQKATADALSLSQPSVSEWKERGVPYLRQLQYESVTHGKLKADPLPLPDASQSESRA